MMNSFEVCASCGASVPPDAADGLCPRCLFQRMVDGWPLHPPDGSTDEPFDGEPGIGAPTRLFGDYELLDELGRGGMGVVYRARQQSLNRVVALKMVLAGQFASEPELQRFRVETEAAANLDHPNIVSIYEVGEEEGRPYYSMRLIDDGNLSQRLKSLQREIRNGLQLMVKVARAVHYAHQNGVLHRDLKPGNILVDAKGEPFVSDFGLAKRAQEEVHVTLSGTVLGTPSYMAPEQARGRPLTTAADIYSLGAILYEMLTGRPPFHADTPLETMRKLVEEEPRRPGVLNKAVDRDLETICLRCLEKEPGRRYPSAGALADDLERWLRHEPIVARSSSSWERVGKWSRRNPARAILSGLVLLLVSVGVPLVLWQWREAVVARREATEKGLGEARALQRATRLLYNANMGLAQSCWNENKITRLRELLRETEDFPGKGFEWHYWQRMLQIHSTTLGVHEKWVLAVAYSPDGKRLATAGNDHKVRIWDAATRQELFELTGHTSGVHAVEFSCDSERILTGSYDKTCRVWDARSGRELLSIFRGESYRTTWGGSGTAFSPDGRRIAADCGRVVKVWDAYTGEKLVTLQGHDEGILSLSFSHSGTRIATGAGTPHRTARIWDAETGRELLVLKGHTNWVGGVRFSPDDRRIATASGDGTVKIWDAITGLELTTMRGHLDMVYRVVFSADGTRIMTSSGDTTLRLWSVATGEELRRYRGHEGRVYDLAISPDGYHLASASEDRTARIWEIRAENESRTLRGHADPIISAAFSADGGRLVTGAEDGTARVWDVRTGQQLLVVNQRAKVQDVAFTPDGQQIATASLTGIVRVWDAVSGEQQQAVQSAKGWTTIRFSPEARHVATGGEDGVIRIIEVATGNEKLVLHDPAPEGRVLAYSADGRWLASAAEYGDGRICRVWDAQSGQALFGIAGTSPVGAMAFSPDGRRIALGHRDESITLWSIADQAQTYKVHGHYRGAASMAFSPDGHRLLTVGSDHIVQIRDPETGAELLSFRKQNRIGTVVAFSPDSVRIATPDLKEIRIWETASPERQVR